MIHLTMDDGEPITVFVKHIASVNPREVFGKRGWRGTYISVTNDQYGIGVQEPYGEVIQRLGKLKDAATGRVRPWEEVPEGGW